MKRALAAFLFHPYLISVLNLLMLVLYYSSIQVTWFHLRPINHFQEAVELWEGYGTILLSFGVFLEERSSLQKIMKSKATGRSLAHEAAVEEVCHDYGVLLVIFGVMIELIAWLVKIPNEVLDTYGIEFALINITAIVATIGAILQIKFQIEIAAAHFKGRRP